MYTKSLHFTATRMGSGFVVSYKDIGQSVYLDYKSMSRAVGDILMCDLKGDDEDWQMDLDIKVTLREKDEAIPVKPEYDSV